MTNVKTKRADLDQAAQDLVRQAMQLGKDQMAIVIHNHLVTASRDERPDYFDGMEDALRLLHRAGATYPIGSDRLT